MFVQVISGRVKDLAGIERLDERWHDELRPGATGFLGSTTGATPDGRFFAASRWESADAASANSGRPEQDAWWSEMQQFVSDVDFHDCNRVMLLGGGGSDAAGFVQVMQGHVDDPGNIDRLESLFGDQEDVMKEARPDILGEVIAVHDDGNGYSNLVYFTSEADARANEGKELPPAAAAMLEEAMKLAPIDAYFDLTEPHLR
jgi:hypothetical protein